MTAPERRDPRERRTDAVLAGVVTLWLLVIVGLLVGVAMLAFGTGDSLRLTWPTGPSAPAATTGTPDGR